MIVQAALNGARTRSYHPRVPHLAAEIAVDAAAAIAAGANEFHIHVHSEIDRESLSPQAVGAMVNAVRAVAPGAFVGISTGSWIEEDDPLRLEYIRAWTSLPDHASVNLDEPGAIEVIRALHERGVGTEAGISCVADVERLRNSGLSSLVLRILVEVSEEETEAAMAEADRVLEALKTLPSQKPILMHGFNATTWPFLERAIAGGFSMRIGLEDTNVLPDGRVAEGNAELVAAAVELVRRGRARH